jgi:hypothetical protein
LFLSKNTQTRWHDARLVGVSEKHDNALDDEFDGLVAAQWGHRSTSRFFDVPERRLLVAVLVDAVRVLTGSNRRERANVLGWIRGQAARIPFLDLCHNLDLDPHRTSSTLLRGRSEVFGREARRSRRASTRRAAVRHGVSIAAKGRAALAGSVGRQVTTSPAEAGSSAA